MKATVKMHLGRALRGHDVDIGLLYIDRSPECLIEMLGSTAIASGRYQVRIRDSPRFRRPLPVLIGAHGFESMRIVPADALTEWIPGCLVPGVEAPGGIRRTRQAFDSVYAQVQAALALGERVRMTIV